LEKVAAAVVQDPKLMDELGLTEAERNMAVDPGFSTAGVTTRLDAFETDWKLQPMFVDTNPFLFRGKVCGAMVPSFRNANCQRHFRRR
jgi:hypothetical protein